MPPQLDYSMMGLCKTKTTTYPLKDACDGNWTWNKCDKSHEVKLHGKVCITIIYLEHAHTKATFASCTCTNTVMFWPVITAVLL